MNAVEIEQAISELAEQPFDAAEFPFAFLAAFGNKDTALKRLRAGNNNTSDVPGGVLQRSNIHIAACEPGIVSDTFKALRTSAATTKAKAKFILATDGQTLEAEDLSSGETISCAYQNFANHFGFFLPLAGISTIKEIKDNPIDVRATGRLNKLYVELLSENPDWATDERRADMNHFMARLVFCFFAEDTNIFNGSGVFTQTVDQMSERDGSNTHEVLSEIFRAMNTPTRHEDKLDNRHRKAAGIRSWADQFPYVNGGLFSGSTEVPRFTRMARTFFMHAGSLHWREINPDIFGSMIQAVADDDERSALGMHYTSVPNILKVLNPLFLDELRAQLDEAGDNKIKLLNLRKRMARIRIFDPACGSGNFLVIAYKQMREIEAEINHRRSETHLDSDIPLTNFRGIELRNFPAEIARLALIIAEFQCDVLYRGQKDALEDFLPLDAQNWIVCGNALRLDWLSLCRPTGTSVKLMADDLFGTPLNQTEIDFANEGGETFICGNPPYLGSVLQSEEQKSDLKAIFGNLTSAWKSLDYVAGWFMKAADYGARTNASSAFVSTNSICQGEQVPILWPLIFSSGHEIHFAYTSFKWANLASNKAGVTVVIVGMSRSQQRDRSLFSTDNTGAVAVRQVSNINAYLVPGQNAIIEATTLPIANVSKMLRGNLPNEGGHLLLSRSEVETLLFNEPTAIRFVKKFIGAREFVASSHRYCLWINDADANEANRIDSIHTRLQEVTKVRAAGGTQARGYMNFPHKFVFAPHRAGTAIAIPAITSENREFLPVGIVGEDTIVGAKCYVMYDAPVWNMALIASRLHWVWIGTVCVRMRTDFSYSNTLGWNTFPVPLLTEQNKADLTACAEEILLAREFHFPSTIAELYKQDNMPDNLRRAHERNDEVLERIYIGRRFKNDTERLEKLFELYTKMTAANKAKPATKASRGIKA